MAEPGPRNALLGLTTLSGATAAATVLSILTNKAIALATGAEGIAVMGLYRGIASVVRSAGTLGYNTLLMQRMSLAQDREESPNVLSAAAIFLGLQAAATCVLAALWPEAFSQAIFGSHDGAAVPGIIRVVLVMAFVNIALETVLSLLKGSGAIKDLAGVQLATAGTSLLLILPLLRMGYLGLAFNVGSGGVVGAAVGAWWVWRRHYSSRSGFRLRAGWGLLRETTSSSLVLAFFGVLLLGTNLGVRSLVGRGWGLPALGIFTAALMVADTLAIIVMSSMRTILLSGLGRLEDESEKSILSSQMMQAGLAVMTLSGLAVILAGRPLLWLLYSDQFTKAAAVLSIMCLSLAAQAVSWHCHTLFLHRNKITSLAILDTTWCPVVFLGTLLCARQAASLEILGWVYTLGFAFQAGAYAVAARLVFGREAFSGRQAGSALACMAALLCGFGLTRASSPVSSALWAAGLAAAAFAAAKAGANMLRACFIGGKTEEFLAARTRKHGPRSWAVHLAPGYRLHPHPSIRRTRWEGLEFELDISRYEEWMVYYGLLDSQMEKLFSLAKPGAVVLDAGCNIGATLLPLAAAVRPDGFAFGFEPDPETRDICARNIALNGLSNAEIVAAALSDRTGSVSFRRDAPSNPAAYRVVLRPEPSDITVQAMTLDQFVDERGLRRLDLIKIDTEGSELAVLKGAAASLGRFRPVLFIEICDRHLRGLGASALEVTTFLRERGYALIDASTGNPVEDGDLPAHFDAIARPFAGTEGPAA